jgi:hypothetical protein
MSRKTETTSANGRGRLVLDNGRVPSLFFGAEHLKWTSVTQMDVSYSFDDCISLILQIKSKTEEWVSPLLKIPENY